MHTLTLFIGVSDVKLGKIAEIAGGRLFGDPNIEISGVAEIQNAQAGQLTFYANPKYRRYLKKTLASAVIVDKYYDDVPASQIVCKEPYVSWAKVLDHMFPQEFDLEGISERASLGKDVKIGRGVFIGDFVYVGDGSVIEDDVKIFPGVYIGKNCRIGRGSVLFPNVVLYDNTILGKNVRIHAGSVIGSDGYGYALSKVEGKIYKVPQLGNVVVEDDVEIGANTTIDRGAIGSTVIGRGSKIDNLVQIAHNVKLGQNCFIVSQVGISGSTKVGNYVTLAGQVGVAGHLSIADNVIVAAKAGVPGDIRKAGVYGGFVAKDFRRWKKIEAITSMLPEIYEKLKKLFKKEGL